MLGSLRVIRNLSYGNTKLRGRARISGHYVHRTASGKTYIWCFQCLLNSSQDMDYFGFSSVSSGSYEGDPLDEDALADAVADLGAPPAPAGFGFVEPSQGLEPHRVTSCGSPWNVSACQSVCQCCPSSSSWTRSPAILRS